MPRDAIGDAIERGDGVDAHRRFNAKTARCRYKATRVSEVLSRGVDFVPNKQTDPRVVRDETRARTLSTDDLASLYLTSM